MELCVELAVLESCFLSDIVSDSFCTAVPVESATIRAT